MIACGVGIWGRETLRWERKHKLENADTAESLEEDFRKGRNRRLPWLNQRGWGEEVIWVEQMVPSLEAEFEKLTFFLLIINNLRWTVAQLGEKKQPWPRIHRRSNIDHLFYLRRFTCSFEQGFSGRLWHAAFNKERVVLFACLFVFPLSTV